MDDARDTAVIEPEENWYGAETATFGDRVAGARETLGISQSELARRLGVRVKTLRDWENDLAEPRANKLQTLAGVLGVSLMWLLNGEGDGIDPPGEAPRLSGAMRDALLEMRSLQTELERSAERLARLEKRMRRLAAEEETLA